MTVLSSLQNVNFYNFFYPGVKITLHVIVLFSILCRLKSDLKKKQKDNDIAQKNLIGECSTRWGSKFDMVNRMVENNVPLQQTLNGKKQFDWSTKPAPIIMFLHLFLLCHIQCIYLLKELVPYKLN